MVMQLPLMLLLLLAPAALGQRTFFCNSFGSSSISDGDFTIITRNSGSSKYLPNMRCSFKAKAYSMYFVEVVMSDMPSAAITIRDSISQIFYGSEFGYSRSFMTRSSSLSVTFESRSSSYTGTGVQLRVRGMSSSDCPPNWVRYGSSSCFGTSTYSGKLGFSSALQACKKMRANLLLLPGLTSRLYQIKRELPASLTQSAWIGMTDLTTYGRYRYRWLDGYSFSSSDVSCRGGSYRYCSSDERCAALTNVRNYLVEMHSCSTPMNYVCYMPAGGTRIYYNLPTVNRWSYSLSGYWAWLWVPVMAGVFFIGFVISFTVRALQRRARTPVSSVGRNTAPLPTGSYPRQQPFTIGAATMQPPQFHNPPPYPTGPPTMPPAYAEAVASAGNPNPAFKY